MRYGSLSKEGKELRQAIVILSKDELADIIAACEEYSKANPRSKKMKNILKELNDIAVF